MDPGLFDLQINEATEFADASDGDSTGAVTVDTGSHTVGEVAGTATRPSATTRARSSASTRVARASSSLTPGAGPLSVDVGKDDDIVCTITNNRVTVGFDKANDQDDNAAVAPGETIHYELTVTVNDGMATGVVVTDTLPAGLTYVADSADPLHRLLDRRPEADLGRRLAR